MNRIQLYIFWRAFRAFMLCVTALIGVVWLTQALQQLDLMTDKGQTFLLFLKITWLILPKFVAFIAPVAVLLAAIYSLNSLNNDSELVIVVNSGGSPLLIMKPLLVLAALITIADASVAHYFAPSSQRQVRAFFTEINSDLISSIIRPGEFANVERGITFYVGARDNNGIFNNVFVADNRAKDQSLTYLAQNGAITRTTEGTFFVLQNGTIHRRPTDRDSISVIDYSSYALDLSTFERQIPNQLTYRKPSENFTPYLLEVDEANNVFVRSPGKFYAEFHNRMASPFYSITYVMIAFLFLGKASNYRNSKAIAVLTTILVSLVLKGSSVAIQSAAENTIWLNALQYILPASAIGIAGIMIWQNIEPRSVTLVRLYDRIEEFIRGLLPKQQPGGGAL